MFNASEAADLGVAIGQMVDSRGLGAISKKDYELLVFHHILKSKDFNNKWNYELANRLKVTESKVKSLRLESSIRHEYVNHKKVLGNIVGKIIDEINKPDFVGIEVFISLENPVERREFEYAIKLTNHAIEYGINKEILKIKASALFEIILANVEKPEETFKKIVRTNIQDKVNQEKILNERKEAKEKIKEFWSFVSNNALVAAVLAEAAKPLLIP